MECDSHTVTTIGVRKKLLAASKEKDCEVIGKWIKSIINHMYWCAASSDGDGDVMVAKWASITNHIQNIHTGHDNALFPECEHKQLTGRDREKKWIKPGMNTNPI